MFCYLRRSHMLQDKKCALLLPSLPHHNIFGILHSLLYPHILLEVKNSPRDSVKLLSCSCALPCDGTLLDVITWSCALICKAVCLPVCMWMSSKVLPDQTQTGYTLPFFIRIYFKTISNPKFTKFQEYFKNKANAHILKRNNYLCWKFLNTVEPCPALGASRYCGHLIFFRRNAWPFSNLDSFHTTPEKFESKRSFIPTVS